MQDKIRTGIILILIAALFPLCAAEAGGRLSLSVSPDKPGMVYAAGEDAVFTIRLENDTDGIVESIGCSVERDGAAELEERTLEAANGKDITLKLKMPENGMLRVSVWGNPVFGRKILKCHSTAVAAPEKIIPAPSELALPGSYAPYWENLRSDERKYKSTVTEKKVSGFKNDPAVADYAFASVLAGKDAGLPSPAALLKEGALDVFDVKISSDVNGSISGVLSMPSGAKEKTLPAILLLNSFDTRSAGAYAALSARFGALVFEMNTYPIDNFREQKYYTDMHSSDALTFLINSYSAPLANNFFGRYYLNTLRVLEYLRSRPEWNGKDLIVCGYGLGGAGALFAAGSDPAVTGTVVVNPFNCRLRERANVETLMIRPEFSGTDKLNYGEFKVEFMPDNITIEIPKDARDGYKFQPMFFEAMIPAQKIKSPVVFASGIDYSPVFPSYSLAAYNLIKTDKSLILYPGASELPPPGENIIGKFIGVK